jgi:uncharacterized Fe-S cluster protein YjdI
MSSFTKKYPLGDHAIVWNPEKCVHSAHCFRTLPRVFNPRIKPWIQPEAATPEEITTVVMACPSGALSMEFSTPESPDDPHPVAVTVETSPLVVDSATSAVDSSITVVEIRPNGPLLIKGIVTVHLTDGTTVEKQTGAALCRCGHSNNKPFCDGAHSKVGFTA